MIVYIDDGAPIKVLNMVKVILGDGSELHITILTEGVIYDRVEGGEVIDSQSVFVDDILPSEEDDDRPPPEVEAAVRATSMRSTEERGVR
jgi:hypothetical protein